MNWQRCQPPPPRRLDEAASPHALSRYQAGRNVGLGMQPSRKAPRNSTASQRLSGTSREVSDPHQARCGLSQSTVSRIWWAFGLQPHRTEALKLSKDPLFIEKVRDIVGLYLDPPAHALVTSPSSTATPSSPASSASAEESLTRETSTPLALNGHDMATIRTGSNSFPPAPPTSAARLRNEGSVGC